MSNSVLSIEPNSLAVPSDLILSRISLASDSVMVSLAFTGSSFFTTAVPSSLLELASWQGKFEDS